MTIKIIKRSEWKARPPKAVSLPIVLPVPNIIITHTMTKPCDSEIKCKIIVKQIQKKHMEQHLDIVYNFLIGGDGQIYEGAGFCTNNLFPKPESSDEDSPTEETPASSDTETAVEPAVNYEAIRKDQAEKENMLWAAIRKYRMTFPTIPNIKWTSPTSTSDTGQDLFQHYLLKKKDEKRMAELEEKFQKVDDSMESLKKTGPKTIGELLEFVASYTEEVTGQTMRPEPWDGSDPSYNGDSISIAFIGDHSGLIKYHQEKMMRSDDDKENHSNRNSNASDLDSLAMNLISHGVETEYIDENRKIKWLNLSKWKDYLKKSLSWVPPTSN